MPTGSGPHKAPEICLRQFPYDGEKADVFSLAVVLYAMQMKSFIFEGSVNLLESIRYKLYLNEKFDKFWPLEPPVSDEFKDLIIKMIVRDP